MKRKTLRRALAGVVSTAMVCAGSAEALAVTVPSGIGLSNTKSATESVVIYSTDFEDGDVSYFSKRGDNDTSVISAVEEETAPSGSTVMAITERSKGWNGPSFDCSTYLEPNTKYIISVKVKAQWYNNINVSLQHTPAGAEEPSYSNLTKGVSDGGWITLETSFSFPSSDTDVSVYIEANDAVDLMVDDFTIKTAPNYMDFDAPSLKDVYADYFKIGTACTASELAPESTQELILKHFNSITAGNELKPENVLNKEACLAMAADGDDTDPQVTLNAARSILDFARDNNIPVRGHVLVWHQQTPLWFFKENYDEDGEWVSKEKMLTRMENYIKNVFETVKKEYPDIDFYAWDVVNECLVDSGSARKPGFPAQDNQYNNSPWVQIFGDNSFIKPAFEFAKKYAPEGCKLYYNDFNEYMKTDAMIALAEEINSDGHYIDGLGLQSHLDVSNNGDYDPFPTAAMYKKQLDKFCATGLDIQITELDATVENQNYEGQAQYYSDIMDAIVANKDSISAVVFWGTTDDQSWRADRDPLLFTQYYETKPCFDSIIDGIEYTIPEPTTAPATQPTTAPATGSDPVAWGDANVDGKVDLQDAVAILQYAALPAKYPLTDEGLSNADVIDNGTSGVNGVDALAIQMVDAKLIAASDLPLTKAEMDAKN